MSTQSSIFAQSRNQVAKDYPALAGNVIDGLFLVICDASLSDAAKDALEKTAATLGYNPEDIAYVNIDALERPLLPNELFEIVEGIDPLSVIATSSNVASLLCEAYRVASPPSADTRIFCREMRLIPNLSALMESPEGKQRAWARLKTLPRR